MELQGWLKELVVAILAMAVIKVEVYHQYSNADTAIAVTMLIYSVVTFHLWAIFMSPGYMYSAVGVICFGMMVRAIKK
jgi:hypothetical protein